MGVAFKCCLVLALFCGVFGAVVVKSGDNLLVNGTGTVELFLKSNYVGINVPQQVNCSMGQMILCFEGTETGNRTYCPSGYKSFLIRKTQTSSMWADSWVSTPTQAFDVNILTNGTTLINGSPYNNDLTLEVSVNKSVVVGIRQLLSGCDVMFTGVSLSRAPVVSCVWYKFGVVFAVYYIMMSIVS